MEIIKRVISLRDFENGSKLYFKVNLLQTIDNLGLMTDIISEYDLGYDLTQYIHKGGQIVGATDSKLYSVKTYNTLVPYEPNFDVKREQYQTFDGVTVNGVDRVTKIDDDEITYTINAKKNNFIGTSGQTIGILYTDNPIDSIILPKELSNQFTTTKVQYMSEGWNKTNMSLTPQIQEEYLLGIINAPEVENDVFIDRGAISVLDKHLRLSEIETLDHLSRYGNGFYKINRN